MACSRPAIETCGTEFTLDVYRQVSVSSADENIFMSPSSILVVMAMLHAGAKGDTLKQLTQGLRFGEKNRREVLKVMGEFTSFIRKGSKSVTLRSANRFYPHVDNSILKEYINLVSTHFGADIEPKDFTYASEAARLEINAWVESETNNKIKNLLPPNSLNSSTVMVVVNAIYFKGNWAAQFDKKDTRKDIFYGLNGPTKVDMMFKQVKKAKYGVSDTLKCEVLELPYEGEKIAMRFILPNDKDGLVALENQLTYESLTAAMSELSPTKVDVTIPKFILESSFDLNDILSTLGMTDMFDEKKADFSDIGQGLFVSKVVHKAFVDVNEEGTEAAAATAAIMVNLSMPPPPKVFKADHPFMFMIWDLRMNLPLFIGRFVNAAAASDGKDEL